MSCFVAIDFETADMGADSACAVGLVRVESGEIVDRRVHLIRPPRPNVMFTHIHGIRWGDVSDKPDFGALWPELRPMLDGAEFLAAHNAGFDKRILKGCCTAYGLDIPVQPFACTVRIARKAWEIFPTKLPNVCDRLGISLNHHDALSDAEACARIVIAAQKDGHEIRAS